MKRSYTFAVVGGDLRQAHLAALLSSNGHSVKAYALEKSPQSLALRHYGSFGETVPGSDFIILPVPVNGAPGCIKAPLSEHAVNNGEIERALSRDIPILCGKSPEWLKIAASRAGAAIIDYFEREELQIGNAVPSAEGAIQVAMEMMPVTLHKSKVLVIGFGRIGKLLAKKLHALGANVTVTARKREDLAWIEACGFESASTLSLENALPGCDAVFNTVPSPILGRFGLSLLPPDCAVIDLASKPGGVDFEAAESLGLKAVHALSLPGKVAPVTAALIIKDTIYNIIKETEESACMEKQ